MENIEEYWEYFFAMTMEVYSVLYNGTNTDKLDEILIEMKEKFPKLDSKSNQKIEDFGRPYFKSEKFKIYNDEVEELIESKNENYRDFFDNGIQNMLELIYCNEELLRKYPTFLEGEFSKFIHRLSADPSLYNESYVTCVNTIMSKLRNIPDLYNIAMDNIVDLSKLDESKGVNYFALDRFASWFNIYDFFKKIAESKLKLNSRIIAIMYDADLFKDENVLDFFYYTLFNYIEARPACVDREEFCKSSKKLQEEKLETLDDNAVNEIFDFFENNKERFKCFGNFVDSQYQILDELKKKINSAKKLEYLSQ